MSAKFFSKASVYQGNYRCIMYNPNYEFWAGAHYHDFYEIQFYFSNAGVLQMGDKRYSLRYGDVALINIFEPHTFILSNKEDYRRFCISVDPSFLLSMCSEQSDLLNIFSPNNRSYPIYHLDEMSFLQVLNILYEYEQADLKHGKDILERALIYQVMAKLYNKFYDSSHQDPTESQYVAIIAKLMSHICEHIKEELSLVRLAGAVNYSEFHVCRLFKKLTGNTLTQYIVSKRIENAKFLLKGSMPVKEICYETGFNNYSYFYKTFKKIVGCNPAEYKASITEGIRQSDNEISQGIMV